MATPLAERSCTVCKPGTPTLPLEQVGGYLSQLNPDWKVADAGGHLQLTRTFRFKSFMPGVELVNRIAEIAEAEGHHPDLHLAYGSLRVELWTHAAGGLTENDFVLAAKIDRINPA
ncbi:MAG TPA: 4a-hydroxytetrahydrobiopterin dehydratase [Candidatus Dormibacteraeota bacterium]|nr:4a-hydroxytetrahydrobiopterin dehydratase [Candidatus Dormibacteraeota bacterium]